MAPSKPVVTVEFFGVPRQRAGKASLDISAATMKELLETIVEQCPQLDGMIDTNGQLAKEYLLSINGERFTGDLLEPLHPNQHLLLLSADAGG